MSRSPFGAARGDGATAKGIISEHRVRIPLLAPLGGLVEREATLLEGPAGWGECSPLPGYPCDPARARRAAEEAAVTGWPAPVRRRVPVNALIPLVGVERATELAREALARGIRCFKVKVGDAGGIDRVAAVRAAVGPGPLIRVDPNTAWDMETATDMIRKLARYELELVEQPVASLDDLARLRRRVDVPLAADESVRGVDDARALARLRAADAVVIKVQPLGGVAAALEVAEAAGVPAIVSSLYETSIGLAAGLALAAALPELPFASGLGTAGLLAGDVVLDPLLPVDGALEVRRPVADPARLERYRVPSTATSRPPT